FIRCSYDDIENLRTIYNLMKTDHDNKEPKLIISCYGGAKYFTMNEDLENEFLRGMAEAATTSGTWILTTGLNSGVSKFIGEGIARFILSTDHPKKTTMIGLTKWGTLTEKTRAILKLEVNILFWSSLKDFC
ncbi:unnamed protein product, partial [Didymodactylos carnosus]